MPYIKVIGTSVAVGGEAANDEMLKDGYFEYKGEIPKSNEFEYLAYENDVVVVKLNAELKKEVEIARANEYLKKSDWVSRYIVLHKAGIEILPENSNKLAIEAKRQEAIALIQSYDNGGTTI